MATLPAYAKNETLGWNAGSGLSVTYSSNAMGSWVEFGRATVDWRAFTARLAGLTTVGARFCVDIAISSTTGDGSPQIVVSNFPFCTPGTTFVATFPIRVPAGAYVYLRGARVGASLTSGAHIIEGEIAHPSLFGGYRYAECLNISSLEPSINIGGSVNDWVECVASTAGAYDALGLVLTNGSDTSRSSGVFAVELGVGAASSEVVLMRAGCYGSAGAIHSELLIARQYVPAGSRVAAKTTKHGGDATYAGIIGFEL